MQLSADSDASWDSLPQTSIQPSYIIHTGMVINLTFGKEGLDRKPQLKISHDRCKSLAAEVVCQYEVYKLCYCYIKITVKAFKSQARLYLFTH